MWHALPAGAPSATSGPQHLLLRLRTQSCNARCLCAIPPDEEVPGHVQQLAGSTQVAVTTWGYATEASGLPGRRREQVRRTNARRRRWGGLDSSAVCAMVKDSMTDLR